MSVFHIILHQNTNSLEAGLMNPQLVLCALTMTKTITKNVEKLQPCVDSFLPWFGSSKELLYLCRMLIHCYWDFGWFTVVAWIANQLFPLWNLEVQSILIPGCFIFISICAYLSATVKENYVVCAGMFRTGYPDDFVVANINDDFIWYSCTVVLVRVPFAVQFDPEFVCFTMNTVDSADICLLWFKWAESNLLCF